MTDIHSNSPASPAHHDSDRARDWDQQTHMTLLGVAMAPHALGALAVVSWVAGAPLWLAIGFGLAHFGTMLFAGGTFAYLAQSDPDVPVPAKWLWCGLLLAATPVAAPLYWFIHVSGAEKALDQRAFVRTVGVPQADAPAAAQAA